VSKKTKRAKPLDAANAHELRQEPPLLNGSFSRTAHGIASAAESLADLHKLRHHMNEAKDWAQEDLEKLREQGADAIRGDAYDTALTASHRFERVEAQADCKVRHLQGLILAMEPQTLDEVLSLVVIFDDALDTYAGNYGGTSQDEAANCAYTKLRSSLLAMVRGLVAAGATSPLLSHYMIAGDLEPWSEAFSTATRDGNIYCLAYDPTEGRLKRREASKEEVSE
jgi:hypothetical protein